MKISTALISLFFCFVSFDATYALDESQWEQHRTLLYARSILTPVSDSTHSGMSAQRYSVRFIEPVFDTLIFHQIDDIPVVRFVEHDEIKISDILKIAALATGYDLLVHHDVNISTSVTIDADKHSLTTVSEYLENVSLIDVSIFPETRMILVTPSADILWSHD